MQIERSDAGLLAREAAAPLRAEVLRFWTSLERFLHHGVGYAAWAGGRPAT